MQLSVLSEQGKIFGFVSEVTQNCCSSMMIHPKRSNALLQDVILPDILSCAQVNANSKLLVHNSLGACGYSYLPDTLYTPNPSTRTCLR